MTYLSKEVDISVQIYQGMIENAVLVRWLKNILCFFCNKFSNLRLDLLTKLDIQTDYQGLKPKSYESITSRVEFPIEKPEGCCIYRHAGIDYIALWDSLLPVREVFAPYVGTYV